MERASFEGADLKRAAYEKAAYKKSNIEKAPKNKRVLKIAAILQYYKSSLVKAYLKCRVAFINLKRTACTFEQL